MCNGQIMNISQNAALFALLGTMYGGNGQTTFGLPNLQSRVPVHAGVAQTGTHYLQGENGGVENVTLTVNQMPMHNHAFIGASALASTPKPVAGVALATTNNASNPGGNFYGTGATVALTAASIQPAGGSGPHSNLQPYLVINWCIATAGVFPSRN